MRVVYIGRFQPFHKGHLAVIKHLAKAGHDILLGIGSVQESRTLRNPFTGGERLNMIHLACEPYFNRIKYVCGLRDTNDDEKWYHLVMERFTPWEFDAIYTNNEHDRKIFEKHGIKMLGGELFERDKYEGTKIRELIAKGSREVKWKYMVPVKTVTYLEDIRAREIIKDAYRREVNESKE